MRIASFWIAEDSLGALLGNGLPDCLLTFELAFTMGICENPTSSSMNEKIYNVLFLCTGNSARSIMGECILNREGGGKFRAFSAGSQPKGEVNPHTIELLESHNHVTEGLRSKSWDEFAAPGAPTLDFIFTVCDQAAQEICPVWPGHPTSAHWGIPDPAAVGGTDADKQAAFAEAYQLLERRISSFVNLPIAALDGLQLRKHLDEIGKAR